MIRNLKLMPQLIILVFLLLTLADPVLLAWLWVRRFAKRNSTVARWRSASLWAALITSTLAIGAFWISLATAPRINDPQRNAYFSHFARFSFAAAAVAVALGLVGKGRERWWIVVSTVVVPMGWVAYAAMQ
jgi:hypothetical protein